MCFVTDFCFSLINCCIRRVASVLCRFLFGIYWRLLSGFFLSLILNVERNLPVNFALCTIILYVLAELVIRRCTFCRRFRFWFNLFSIFSVIVSRKDRMLVVSVMKNDFQCLVHEWLVNINEIVQLR